MAQGFEVRNDRSLHPSFVFEMTHWVRGCFAQLWCRGGGPHVVRTVPAGKSKRTLLEMFYFSQILKVFSSDTGTSLHRPTPLYTRFRRRASPMLRAVPHR